MVEPVERGTVALDAEERDADDAQVRLDLAVERGSMEESISMRTFLPANSAKSNR
jgi:hypothetical protein